jgi:hypothetical protein
MAEQRLLDVGTASDRGTRAPRTRELTLPYQLLLPLQMPLPICVMPMAFVLPPMPALAFSTLPRALEPVQLGEQCDLFALCPAPTPAPVVVAVVEAVEEPSEPRLGQQLLFA